MKFECITENIFLLKTPFGEVWSGVYLVRGTRNILIDSGANAEVVDQVIVPALAETGLSVEDIDLLLCTHTHGDHIGGHRRLKQLGRMQCGVIESGADKLEDPLKYSRAIRAVFPEYSPAPPPVLRGVKADLIFRGGDLIDSLKIIHTPGHDSDCVCFLDQRSGVLLSGDSLQGNGTAVQGCALYMDLPAYRNSLEKLQREPMVKVVPGHHFLPREVSPGQCLELTLLYDKLISEAYRDGMTSDVELAEYLIREIRGRVPEYLFLPLFTINEHLKYVVK